ncbi:MAG: DUF1492 domain-containing protein [Bdellovibrionales bacterium]|nr:DUF1492 domain-containing protein [Bdellovibrionales bacterium]
MSQIEKLILVTSKKNDTTTELVKNFAKQARLEFSTYTEDEWATLEEIDQYIQDEEVSKQVVQLPIGKNEDVSLENITKKHIKKILYLKQLNVNEVAKTLKISRATLYRKMEKNGLNIKEERKEMLKKQRKQVA